jgi:hypothetical protein
MRRRRLGRRPASAPHPQRHLFERKKQISTRFNAARELGDFQKFPLVKQPPKGGFAKRFLPVVPVVNSIVLAVD